MGEEARRARDGERVGTDGRARRVLGLADAQSPSDRCSARLPGSASAAAWGPPGIASLGPLRGSEAPAGWGGARGCAASVWGGVLRSVLCGSLRELRRPFPGLEFGECKGAPRWLMAEAWSWPRERTPHVPFFKCILLEGVDRPSPLRGACPLLSLAVSLTSPAPKISGGAGGFCRGAVLRRSLPS